MVDFRFDIILEYAPYFWKGTLFTIGISIVSVIFGAILGMVIALGKMMKNKWLAFPFAAYVAFFRGTPLFLQILLVHFGLVPVFLNHTNGIVAAITALSLNCAAYTAEIFRAGIQSIDSGQMEGARSLGLTHTQAMRYIILPQAVKRMIPPLGNEIVVLIKDSSLAAVIAAPEIMYWGRAMAGEYVRVWEPYLTASAIYLVLTLTLSTLLSYIERRLKTE